MKKRGIVGKTFARGVINGRSTSLEFSFLVDTGATWLTLPRRPLPSWSLT